MMVEREQFMLGSWVTFANEESKVQILPHTFLPIWDNNIESHRKHQTSQPFDTPQMNKQEFIE